MIDAIVISCEHGGNVVPKRYEALFANAERLLMSHVAFDLGALPTARRLARAVRAPLYVATVTRLLIDLNRSLHHRQVFSPRSRRLPPVERDHLVERYYRPHREAVESAVAARADRGSRVLHIGVHTFAPVRRGERRRADIGLLYDPSRPLERLVTDVWRDTLRIADPRWSVRRNYPYRGAADGLTTFLRTRFPPNRYAGVELEINQRHFRRSPRPEVLASVVETFRTVATHLSG